MQSYEKVLHSHSMYILKREEAEMLKVWSRNNRTGLRPACNQLCQPPAGTNWTFSPPGGISTLRVC
ncbi:hypothetical protein D3C87_1722550 [compost metagenome]